MNYYKFISGEDILSVTDSPIWVRVSDRGRLLRCEASEASGVLSDDRSTVYHIAGTKPLGDGVYKDVLVSDITEDEYNTLSKLLNQCQNVQNDVPPGATHKLIDVSQDDTVYLEYLRSLVLRAMSAACHAVITGGVDIELSNGATSHFDLSVEDQLNIISALDMLEGGADSVPFHASGEPFKYFSAADIRLVAEKADEHKTWQTVYHNSLKKWIMSMTSATDLQSVYYGVDIPREYCSEVFLQMQHN